MKAEVRPLKMREKLTQVVDNYWNRLWEHHRAGGLVAWCSSQAPLEVLKALDIEVVIPELYGATCSFAGVSAELCQKADALGYSPDLCSVIRTSIGVTHGIPAPDPEILPWGGMPKPDLLLCQPYCPGLIKTWEEYSRFFNVPLLVMERSYLHDGLSNEEITYLTKVSMDELKEIISFLERFTGRRMDYDRLSQMVSYLREASRLWWDSLEMCRSIPAPMSAFDAFAHFLPFNTLKGELGAVAYYRELKAELTERVAQKIVPMVSEEKYRLYWDNLPIFFKIAEHTDKFASYGAVPVVAPFPFYFGRPELDSERPLQSIVELLLLGPLNKGVKGRMEFISKLVESYSIDGLVMQRSRTCQLVNMGQDDIMKALIERTGLPAVVIEGDVCDPRFYSESEFNGKIDAFMEMLARR